MAMTLEELKKRAKAERARERRSPDFRARREHAEVAALLERAAVLVEEHLVPQGEAAPETERGLAVYKKAFGAACRQLWAARHCGGCERTEPCPGSCEELTKGAVQMGKDFLAEVEVKDSG